jgi:hypothetical protein
MDQPEAPSFLFVCFNINSIENIKVVEFEIAPKKQNIKEISC